MNTPGRESTKKQKSRPLPPFGAFSIPALDSLVPGAYLGPKKKSTKVKKNTKKTSKKAVRKNTVRNYTIPNAVARVVSGGSPSFKSTNRGTDPSIRIIHSEFVDNVVATTAFTTRSYVINPGRATMWPWLAVIAMNFESYTIESVQFRFVPIVSTNTVGRVAMAIDYDATDPAPATKARMSSYSTYQATNAWGPLSMRASQAALHKVGPTRYVSNGTDQTGDPKLYDAAVAYIATEFAAADGTMWGELYVDYVVRLITPQLNAIASQNQNVKTNSPIVGTYNTIFNGSAINSAGLNHVGAFLFANDTAKVRVTNHTGVEMKRKGTYDFTGFLKGIVSNGDLENSHAFKMPYLVCDIYNAANEFVRRVLPEGAAALLTPAQDIAIGPGVDIAITLTNLFKSVAVDVGERVYMTFMANGGGGTPFSEGADIFARADDSGTNNTIFGINMTTAAETFVRTAAGFQTAPSA